MAKTTLSASIDVDGARQTLAAFRKLPADADEALRDGSLKLSRLLARRVRAAGRVDSEQSAAVARTVKAVRGRVPAITVGGTTRVTSSRVPASSILFGSEFGARHRFGWFAAARYKGSRSRQYRPHQGRGSYWIFRTVDANTATIGQTWLGVADEIVGRFTAGGR